MISKSLVESKETLLEYSTVTSLSFEDLRKKISGKQFVQDVSLLLTDLMKVYNTDIVFNTKTTKLFLTSYMLYSHTKVITNNDNYSQRLGQCAGDLINSLETLFEKFTITQYNIFVKNFKIYVGFFGVWKERDCLLTIRPILNSYFELDLIIAHTKEEDRKTDYRLVQKKIRENILLIAGETGIDFLEKKELPYFKDEQIFNDMEATVQKAFWDVFEENIKSGDLKHMGILLGEVKGMFLEIAPRLQEELDEYLDIDLINKMIEAKLVNNDAIHQYMTYIIEKIKSIQAAADDKDTDLFLQNVNDMFKNRKEINETMKYFFKNTFHKLEKIKHTVNVIRAQIAASKKE